MTSDEKLNMILRSLRELRWALYILNLRARVEMSLSQDILDAVSAETTAVDSFMVLVQGLIDNNTIPAAVGAEILSAINAEKTKVDAAILKNTPPPTP